MVMRRKRRRKQEMQPIRESNKSYGEGVNVRGRKGASVNVISVI